MYLFVESHSMVLSKVLYTKRLKNVPTLGKNEVNRQKLLLETTLSTVSGKSNCKLLLIFPDHSFGNPEPIHRKCQHIGSGCKFGSSCKIKLVFSS
jgi:hypothetical protein